MNHPEDVEIVLNTGKFVVGFALAIAVLWIIFFWPSEKEGLYYDKM